MTTNTLNEAVARIDNDYERAYQVDLAQHRALDNIVRPQLSEVPLSDDEVDDVIHDYFGELGACLDTLLGSAINGNYTVEAVANILAKFWPPAVVEQAEAVFTTLTPPWLVESLTTGSVGYTELTQRLNKNHG